MCEALGLIQAPKKKRQKKKKRRKGSLCKNRSQGSGATDASCEDREERKSKTEDFILTVQQALS
jgi:hypothetical protein